MRRLGLALAALVAAPAFAPPRSLGPAFEELWALLASRPFAEEGLAGIEELHELAPPTPRAAWDELGALVAAREGPEKLEGSKWVSLRLDGCMFGKLTQKLRAAGLIGPGYSEELGEMMRLCCRVMMDEFKASVGYTHSDEMTVILSPRNISRNGEVMGWPHNGRIQKWVSIAASIATALVNRRLLSLAQERGMVLPADALAHFDCRAGLFDTEAEASALLLWRAFDCSVNCVQDCCHHAQAPLEVVRSGFAEKLRWLKARELLPLSPHQAYGSFFVKSSGEFEVTNPELKETVRVNRKVNIQVNDGSSGRNLLRLPRQLLPLLPKKGDPRLELREGSYWRHVGTSGFPEAQQDRRNQPRRRKKRW
ncbi:unnamed protein product [Effrenium voratum]|uniref:tRNAHis guanylyltransferase catalytic domain-containing protein n=1 Tax=Effrenium voratum TaxID=2562239 RepID=A0AA36J102_9DINO|nr:unnamed protein product [Effrenium voratum]CAJ1420098.1 unnamed protein product [Effrenium voratum]